MALLLETEEFQGKGAEIETRSRPAQKLTQDG